MLLSFTICWFRNVTLLWYYDAMIYFSEVIMWKLQWRDLSQLALTSPLSLRLSSKSLIRLSFYLSLSWNSPLVFSNQFLRLSCILSSSLMYFRVSSRSFLKVSVIFSCLSQRARMSWVWMAMSRSFMFWSQMSDSFSTVQIFSFKIVISWRSYLLLDQCYLAMRLISDRSFQISSFLSPIISLSPLSQMAKISYWSYWLCLRFSISKLIIFSNLSFIFSSSSFFSLIQLSQDSFLCTSIPFNLLISSSFSPLTFSTRCPIISSTISFSFRAFFSWWIQYDMSYYRYLYQLRIFCQLSLMVQVERMRQSQSQSLDWCWSWEQRYFHRESYQSRLVFYSVKSWRCEDFYYRVSLSCQFRVCKRLTYLVLDQWSFFRSVNCLNSSQYLNSKSSARFSFTRSLLNSSWEIDSSFYRRRTLRWQYSKSFFDTYVSLMRFFSQCSSFCSADILLLIFIIIDQR